LRILLLHVRGATSFLNLRTVNRVEYATFYQAAEAMHLIADDQEWTNCLEDARQTEMPAAMRLLYANICANCGPSDPLLLWETFRESMSEDIQHRFNQISQEDAYNIALTEIKLHLNSMGVLLGKLGLPEPYIGEMQKCKNCRNANIGVQIMSPHQHLQQSQCLSNQLNPEQRVIFDQVETALNNYQPLFAYIHGPGGAGKTFLYTAIAHLVKARNEIIHSTAWSGIAASLLHCGQTCHSKFGLPVPFDSDSTSRFSLGSTNANELANARVIVCDEASSMPGSFLNELNRLLNDFSHTVDCHFGNKIILFGGDFKQTLPVCKRAVRAEIVSQCINQQELFQQLFLQYQLTRNMRLNQGQEAYGEWLERLGNGQLPRYEGLHNDLIRKPAELILQDKVTVDENGQEIRNPSTEQDLIDFVFGNPFDVEASYRENRIIVAPLNTNTMHINEMIYTLLPGKFYSILKNSQNSIELFENFVYVNKLPKN
jgi:hypothetical protein